MHPQQEDFGTIRQMPNQLVLSTEGLAHIKLFEGFRAETYDDLEPNAALAADGSGVIGTLTIGYGHTGRAAYIGNRITEADAEALLLDELSGFEEGIERLVKVPLSQGEYDALVGFAYNIGLGALQKSTLLRKLNAFDYDGAAMEFGRWVYSKGRRPVSYTHLTLPTKA